MVELGRCPGLGIVLVASWGYSESIGAGDLRGYLLLQVVPAITLPLIILLFEDPARGDRHLVAILLTYAAAFGFEKIDLELFQLTGLISGHSMKHLVAALTGFILLRHLAKASR